MSNIWDNKDHRFYTFHNRSAFLHAEYCLPGQDTDFRKIKIWAGKTQNGSTIQDASHYLDFPDVRFMCFNILRGIEPGPENAWTSVKGIVSKGTPTCRVMKIRRGSLADSKKNRADESHKYFLTVGVGPGRETNGVVLPDAKAPKEAWTFTTLKYSLSELQTFALELQAWVNGITAAEIEQIRKAHLEV